MHLFTQIVAFTALCARMEEREHLQMLLLKGLITISQDDYSIQATDNVNRKTSGLALFFIVISVKLVNVNQVL